MPLRPADVHHVAFSKPPLGKRGYRDDEVDTFLDLVESELARLIQDNEDLRRQVGQFDERWRAAPVDTSPALHLLMPARSVTAPLPPPVTDQPGPGGDPDVQAAKVLGLAQQMADRLTGEAKAEADGMLCDARSASQRLLAGARTQADGMVTEARTRAETLLTNVRIAAEIRDRKSQERAGSVQRDATHEHTEILAALNQEKTILVRKIDELRGLECEYRTRLKTYLDSQLRGLIGRGSVAAPMRAAGR
ncbi:MAG: DivIVA-like cell division protein Wag31 [Pseudonocardiaceae bacterium]